MKKMTIAGLSVVCMLTFSQVLRSQVYRFKPTFNVDVYHTVEKKTKKEEKWWPYCRTTDMLGIMEFVFDVDQKKITDPNYYSPKSVTSVVRDEINKRLVLYIEPIIKGIRWEAYIIQFAGDGITPLYFQKANNSKDSPVTDSVLHVYSDDLRHIPFLFPSGSMKEDANLSANPDRLRVLSTAFFNKADNKVWMLSGVVYWTHGAGKDAVTEHFIVDSVTVLEAKGNSTGVNIACHPPDDPGAKCMISYTYSSAFTQMPAGETYRSSIYTVAITRRRSTGTALTVLGR